jgi:branched-chain amino acid transport system substrate-binding protein
VGVLLCLLPVTGQASEPLIVGVLHSEVFPYAVMMKHSFEMAKGDINAAGGIKGRPLQLVYADDRGQREAGERAVRRLIQDQHVIMLVGAYHSSNTVYMARIAEKLDRPLVVCTAADDRITQRKWKNVFRINPPASDYARGLEDFLITDIKPRSMAIIYENSPYGTGGALRMMMFCRENDIETPAIIPYHKERAKDVQIGSAYFQRLLKPLKVEPPDTVYMVAYLQDAALLVQTLRAMALNVLLCGGAGGFTHQRFIQKTGQDADDLVTATLWTHQLPYAGTNDYHARYVRKYATPPDYHGAEAYAALMVAADALRRAQTLDPAGIRLALRQTDYETAFGPVKFDNYGKFERQNRLPTMVLQIIDGQFECIWPRKLATAPFRPPQGWRPSD